MNAKIKFPAVSRSADCQSAVSRIGNPPGARPCRSSPNPIRRHSRLTICATLFVLAAFAPAKIFACAACFGPNIDSPMADGMNWAILALGAVLTTVLGGFLTFLIYAIRKSEAMEVARVAGTKN